MLLQQVAGINVRQFFVKKFCFNYRIWMIEVQMKRFLLLNLKEQQKSGGSPFTVS